MAQDTITPQQGFSQFLESELAARGPDMSPDEVEAIAIRFGVELPEGFSRKVLPTTAGQKAIRTGQHMGSAAMGMIADTLEMAEGMGEDALQKMDQWKLMDPEGEHGEFGAVLAGRVAKAVQQQARAVGFLGRKFREAEAGAITSPELVGRGGYVGETMAPALASGLMMMSGGYAGAVMKLPWWATTAPLGALQNAAPAYLEIEEAGGSIEDKWTAAILNGAFGGVTETIGLSGPLRTLSRVFSRADKASGGTLGKALVATGLGVLKSGAAEAGTEAAQSGFQDLLFEHLTDQDRDVLGNMLESGEVGLWMGLLFGGLASPTRLAQERGRPTVGPPGEPAPGRPPAVHEEAVVGEAAEAAEKEKLARDVEAEEAAIEAKPAEAGHFALLEDASEGQDARSIQEAREFIEGAKNADAALAEVLEDWKAPKIEPEKFETDVERRLARIVDLARGKHRRKVRTVTEAEPVVGGEAAPRPAPGEPSPPSPKIGVPPTTPSQQKAVRAKLGEKGFADKIIRDATESFPGEEIQGKENLKRAAEALRDAGVSKATARRRLFKLSRERIIGPTMKRTLEQEIQVSESNAKSADGQTVAEVQENRRYWQGRADEAREQLEQGLLNSELDEIYKVGAAPAKFPEYGEKAPEVAAAAVEGKIIGRTKGPLVKGLDKTEVNRQKIRRKIGLQPGDKLKREQLGRSAQAAQEEGLSRKEWYEATRVDRGDVAGEDTQRKVNLENLERELQETETYLKNSDEILEERSQALREARDTGDARDVLEAQDLVNEAKSGRDGWVKMKAGLLDRKRKMPRVHEASLDSIWKSAQSLQFGKQEGEIRQAIRKKTGTFPGDPFVKKDYPEIVRTIRESGVSKAAGRQLLSNIVPDTAESRPWEAGDLEHERDSLKNKLRSIDEGDEAYESVAELQRARKEIEGFLAGTEERLAEMVDETEFDRLWGPDERPPGEDYETAGVTRTPKTPEEIQELEDRRKWWEKTFEKKVPDQILRAKIRTKMGLEPGDEMPTKSAVRSAVIARQMGLKQKTWQYTMAPDLIRRMAEDAHALNQRADEAAGEADNIYPDEIDPILDAKSDVDIDSQEWKTLDLRQDEAEKRWEVLQAEIRELTKKRDGLMSGDFNELWEAAGSILEFEGGWDGMIEMHAGFPLKPVGKAALKEAKGLKEAMVDWFAGKLDEAGIRPRHRVKNVNLTKRQWLYQKFIDRLVPVQRVSEDLYQDEGLRKGNTKARLDEANRNEFKPVIRKIKAMGASLEEADQYSIALHAPERNEALVKRQAEFRTLQKQIDKATADGDWNLQDSLQDEYDLLWGAMEWGQADLKWDTEANAPSGMSDSDAAAIKQRFEKKYGAAAAKDMAKALNKVNQKTLAVLKESGLITTELHDLLRNLYPNYVPLRTFMREELGREGAGPPLQRAKGRESMAESPIAFSMQQLQVAHIRAEKNKVYQRLFEDMEANPDNWEGVAKHYKPAAIPKIRSKPLDRSFKVWIDGAVHLIVFDKAHTNTAKALNGMNVADLDRISKAVGTYSRMMAKLSTRYNPAFSIPNGIRDVLTAYIHGKGYEITEGPNKGKNFSRLVAMDAVPAMAALSKVSMEKSGGKWDPWINRYEASGAPIAFLELKDTQDFIDEVQKELESIGKDPGMIVRAGQKFKQIAEATSDNVENGTRLAFFKHAIEDLGMTDAEAAAAAKDLTVNFERRGDYGNILNAWFMFSNAGLQGSNRAYRGMKRPKIRRLIYKAFAAQVGWSMVVRAMMGQDDDGEDLYDKLPPHERDLNFIIPLPDGGRFTIPLPRVYSSVNSAANNLADVLTGNIEPGEATGRLFNSVVQEFSPVDMGQGALEIVGNVGIPLPTPLQLPVQLWTNRDWKGSPIRPQKWDPLAPDSSLAWDDSPAWLVNTMKGLNRWTGGTDYKPGLVDVSPETVEHVFEVIGGGLGASLKRGIVGGVDVLTGDIPETHEIPILRRLLKVKSPFRTTGQFKSAVDELEREHSRKRAELGDEATVDPMLSAGRKAKEKALDLRREADEASGATRDRLLEEAESTLQNFMRAHKEGKAPKPAQKKKKTRRVSGGFRRPGSSSGFRKTTTRTGGFR
jgi:hypothetical protein